MILRTILAQKNKEVASARRKIPTKRLLAAIQTLPPARPFIPALLSAKKPAVIAEIKRRSPSRGLIRADFRPGWIARRYRSAGAAALSVLTDRKFFGGSADALREARGAVRLPILRKDFMVDDYQIIESRAMGADAVLLIAAALSKAKLKRLDALARRLGLTVLFEIHTAAEWKKIRALKPRLVGINNRNLRTFKVDLAIFERLSRLVPKGTVLVAESGIHTPEDVVRMKRAGARAILVGEGLMKCPDPGKALKYLLV